MRAGADESDFAARQALALARTEIEELEQRLALREQELAEAQANSAGNDEEALQELQRELSAADTSRKWHGCARTMISS